MVIYNDIIKGTVGYCNRLWLSLLRRLLLDLFFLARRLGSVLSLLSNYGLHLCEGIVELGFLEFHLEMVYTMNLHTCDHAAGESLDCNCSLKDQLLYITPLISQGLNFVLHEAGVLSQLNFSSNFVRLEFGKELLLLVDRGGKLSDLL